MIIACDVDGIICALHTEWLFRYNRDYNDTLTLEQWLGWGVHEYVKPECGRKIYNYLNQPDFYDSMEPVDGAVEGVAALRAMGHDLCFVTACTYGMVDQKARWLERWGFVENAKNGHDLPRDFIVMLDKNRLDAHLLIDDGAHNIRAWIEGKRRKAIMLEYPFNRHILDEVPSTFWSWCDRAKTWRDIVRFVAALDSPATAKN